MPLVGWCLVRAEGAFIDGDDKGIVLVELCHESAYPESFLIVGGVAVLELTTNDLFSLQVEGIVQNSLYGDDSWNLTWVQVLE